jgi:hypothetical protein
MVSKVYASGPAMPAAAPAIAAPANTSLDRLSDHPVGIAISRAAAIPTTRTANLSGGSQSGERSSKTKDQIAVTATPSARNSLARTWARCCHMKTAPIPIKAPIAGASAIV